MLILTRKAGQSFLVGDDVEITVLDTGTDKVRIAIDAPRSVQVLRKELAEARETNQEALRKEPVASAELLNLKHMLDARKGGSQEQEGQEENPEEGPEKD